jgi:F-type H+-transporting ATPase subunit b
MLNERQKTIEDSYKRADEAEKEANEHKEAYESKLKDAKDEANNIISNAVSTAKAREKEILADAKTDGERIVAQARQNAELEIKKAEEILNNLESAWEKMSQEQRQAICRELIDKVEVNKDGDVKLVLKIQSYLANNDPKPSM